LWWHSDSTPLGSHGSPLRDHSIRGRNRSCNKFDRHYAAEGTAAIVSGWGNRTAEQGEADYSSILHAVELSISDDAQCQDVYGEDLEDTLICAAVEGAEKDSCSGDSGGPLSVMVDGSPVQVGIVSFGFGCAQPGFPGVYTRVSKFDSFVSDIISQTFTITDSVNFVPAIDISSNLSETVTITSLTENVTLDISGAQLSLGNGLSIDQDSCSAQSLPAGKSCTIELLWNPVEASTLVDELTVELSDGANITKVVIPITGQALVQLDSSLAEVLDLPMQTYFHDDNADWVITDSEFFEGGSALISGDLSTTSTTGTTIFATKGPSEFGFSVKGVNTAMDILFNGELITGDIGFELVDEWLTLGFGGLDESNDLTLIFTATGSPATVNIDKFEIFDGTTFPDPVEPVGPTPVDPTPVDPTPVPNFGYVFERTDGGELRWIAPNNEGILGSVWIDAVCAELLGGVSAKGDWEELNNQAPALDSIAYPCGLVAADDLDGFVFERSDGGELRWITKNSEGINGSIWIDEECAGLLGGVEQVGDWADLNELAPGLDTVDYPCELGVIEGSQKPPPPGIDGFVFGRTDKDELRWIAPNNEGVLGSVWIDATCAEALGGVVLEGDWQELMEIAPGLDTIDPPC